MAVYVSYLLQGLDEITPQLVNGGAGEERNDQPDHQEDAPVGSSDLPLLLLLLLWHLGIIPGREIKLDP